MMLAIHVNNEWGLAWMIFRIMTHMRKYIDVRLRVSAGIIDRQIYTWTTLYTRQKKKVGQLKKANISHKTFHYIVDMHIFLKLIQFQIFWWVKRLEILSGGEMASNKVIWPPKPKVTKSHFFSKKTWIHLLNFYIIYMENWELNEL